MAEDRRYWVRLPRDVITVAGPEAEAYLQGQLSQDVSGLAPGGSAWSWLLAPTGKVDALLRVSRPASGDWILDTDAGWGEAVLSRLQRFKLRTKAEMALVAAAVIGLRGDGWDLARIGAGAAVVATPPWPGLTGADLVFLGDGPALPGLDAGSELSPGAYEAVRIRAGQPRMGSELGEKTIPGETGLVPFTVSFTKGCYTGQELVARIDSRGGNVPRSLVRLRSEAAAEGAFGPGTELFAGDRPAGSVTSAEPAPEGGWVGLGYVRRGVEASGPLSAGPAGPPVVMEPLPW